MKVHSRLLAAATVALTSTVLAVGAPPALAQAKAAAACTITQPCKEGPFSKRSSCISTQSNYARYYTITRPCQIGDVYRRWYFWYY